MAWKTGAAVKTSLSSIRARNIRRCSVSARLSLTQRATFNRLDAPAREKLFHDLFHPAEMGLNVCRTCIGSSDYSTEVFSYDEGELIRI